MFLDVTLQPRKAAKEEVKEEKAAYDWCYENSINTGNKIINMDQPQEFKYSQWRTNGSLSNHQDTIFYVNETNINHHLTDKLHYHFLFYSIRKAKRFGKKKTDADKKLEQQIKKQQELIALISDYYKYNTQRAKEVLNILTSDQIDFIRKKQEKGGA